MKVIRYIAILVALILVLSIPTIRASSLWNFTYDESGDDAYLSISYSSDGYVIATGYSMSQYPQIDVWTPLGKKILSKTLLPNSGAIGIASVEHDGYIYSTGAVDDGYDASDVFFAKVDMKTGKTIFLKTLGGNGTDEPRGIAYVDGNLVIIGNTNSTSGTFPCGEDGEGFVAMINTNGNLLWSECIHVGDSTELNDIFVKDGYIYIVGSTSSDFLTDILVMKLDKDGNIIWQKTLGGKDYDYGYGITGDTTGLYIAGTTFSGNIKGFHGKSGMSSDGLIAALTYDGKLRWIKPMGGTSDDELFDITTTFLGPVATGYTTSKEIKGYSGSEDFYIVSLTEYGKVRYEKAWGGSSTKEELWGITSSPYDILFSAGWIYTGKIVYGNVSGIDEDGQIIETAFPYNNAITLRIWNSIYLKGSKIAHMDKGVFPFIDPRYSRSLVPIRFVAEGLGYKVDWDNKNRIVTITGNSKTIKIYMKDAINSKTSFSVRKPTGESITMTVYEGSQVASVNGRNITLSAKPLIYENRTFVPIRFISETMGSTVKWIPPDGVRIIP